MSGWIAAALEAVRRGETLAMTTVVGAEGSTPREAGARMLVWPDRFTGTIGGGALERQALDQARRLLARQDRAYAIQDYPLGPLLGQCCGGHVRLLVERIDGASLSWLEAAAAAGAAGAPFRLEAEFREIVRRRITADTAGPDLALKGPGARRPAPGELEGLSERVRPDRPLLLIFGAGHVARAVARAFEPLPLVLAWLASREDLPPEPGPVQPALLSEPELEARIAAAPAGACFAIFTHSHDLDYRLIRAVLARGDFAYAGLIGSATKRVRFERRLRADGIAEDALARLTCPIGLAGLRSKAPAVIAVALAAELLQLTEAA